MTRTFWATVEDPRAIVKTSFRGKSIAVYSRKSIRIGTGTDTQRYQSVSGLRGSQSFDFGAARPATIWSLDRTGRTR